MLDSARILVLIPAYNEQENIGKVLTDLINFQKSKPFLDICVINDGSQDDTEEVAKSFPISLLNLPVNSGVGAAVRTGYIYAHLNDYQTVIQFDADGQHDVSEINSILEEASENSIVIGSRFLGNNNYAVPKSTRVAQILLSITLRIFHNLKIQDPTSGFRVSKGREVISYYSRNYPISYLEDTVGSIIQANRKKFKIHEISTPMNQRNMGLSSQNFGKKIKYFIYALLIIIFWRGE